MRSGSACSSDSGSTFSSMPIRPKNRPQAPRLNATGKPSSRKTMRPANMIGARFWVRNSIACLRRCRSDLAFGFRQAADLLGEFLLGRLLALLQRRVLDQAHGEGDAL